MLVEGRKIGSLMFCLRIWFWNNIPIPWDQSAQNQIFGKKYVCG